MTGAVRTALILGANGQDGSYLCDILCTRGYDVIAASRQPLPRWPAPQGRYRYVSCDIADTDALATLLQETAPDIVFHFAAIHGAAGFDYEKVWRQAHQVNTVSAHAVLEYIRTEKPGCALVYASSAKAFGATLPAHVDESTPRHSTCIYSTTKNAAHSLIDYYRARHGVRASVLYLFNHESPRREVGYFIPRIADALAKALADGTRTDVYTLDFACDWGDAQEYMDIAADIGERGLGEDYVLSTGHTWDAREMVQQLFARHGLQAQNHINETAPATTAPIARYRADNSLLQARLGRTPARTILDVLDDILRQAKQS